MLRAICFNRTLVGRIFLQTAFQMMWGRRKSDMPVAQQSAHGVSVFAR